MKKKSNTLAEEVINTYNRLEGSPTILKYEKIKIGKKLKIKKR